MTAHLSAAVRDLAAQNEKSLREMRYTVDEKLSATLEQRLEGSYRIIADNLNKVALGIGEVNKLADSVSDIKKIFTNVKVRGRGAKYSWKICLRTCSRPSSSCGTAA